MTPRKRNKRNTAHPAGADGVRRLVVVSDPVEVNTDKVRWYAGNAPILIPPSVYAEIGLEHEVAVAMIRLEGELALAELDLAGYDTIVARAKEDLTWEFRPTL